ncbi:hypothetical protein GCM10010393_49580 [Streptomyces gobitricini]|uniref:Transposase n=1 Tax=Streptomyces gobitricini TaxID=68211 RepID=A0ABN3MY92_9ACTN
MRNLPESRHAPVNSVLSQFDRLDAVSHGKGEYAPHAALSVVAPGKGEHGIKRSTTIRTLPHSAQTGPRQPARDVRLTPTGAPPSRRPADGSAPRRRAGPPTARVPRDPVRPRHGSAPACTCPARPH